MQSTGIGSVSTFRQEANFGTCELLAQPSALGTIMAKEQLEHPAVAEEQPEGAAPGDTDEFVNKENLDLEEAERAAAEEAEENLRREREARAQALTLEIVGDLPYAEVKPPENVLFVCKLNPVTAGERDRHPDPSP